MTTTTATDTTATDADTAEAQHGSSSRTQAVEEEAAYYYGALYGLMHNMDSPLLPLRRQPALSLVSADATKKETEEEMTTALLLLDGALCDMVAVSTPRTARRCRRGVVAHGYVRG